MATTRWFAALALLLLAVDEAHSVCSSTNMVATPGTAASTATAYSVQTFTLAGTYASNDNCYITLGAPANYKFIFQPTSVDAPCQANGTAGGANDGEGLGYFDSADSSGTMLIHMDAGCSDTATGTPKTDYPVKATTGIDLHVHLAADSGAQVGAGFTVKYMAGKDDSGTCSTTAEALSASNTAAYLTSPGFPGAISVSAIDCVYTITGTAIIVTPIVIDLQGTQGTCGNNDHVQLLNGTSTSVDELAKLCGIAWTFSPAFYTSTAEMTVKVKMTVQSGNFGFALKYTGTGNSGHVNTVGLLTIFMSLACLFRNYIE